MLARRLTALIVFGGLAVGCGAKDRSADPLALATPAVSSQFEPPEASWTTLAVPAELGEGAALAEGPNGSLLLVSTTTLAESRDDGATWEVRPITHEETLYTNKGGDSWVDASTVAEPWYSHGPIEASRQVIAAGSTANRALVFALGTYGTAVKSLPLGGAMGTAIERVYLSTGGRVADGISYSGPSLASFDVSSRPVMVGRAHYRTVVYVDGDGDGKWRAAWRGPENGPEPRAVRMVTDALGYLLVADGTLYETSDGLLTWQFAGFLPPDVAKHARALTPVGQTGLVAVGDRGLALLSSDRGRSWCKSSCPDRVNLRAVASDGQSRVWAVGEAGAVVESNDSGEHFQRVPLPVGRSLDGVLVRRGRAWILAGDVLYRSP